MTSLERVPFVGETCLLAQSLEKVSERAWMNLKCLFPWVVLPGFEPGMTEPKPVVLPLHHSTILIVAFSSEETLDRGVPFVWKFASLCRRKFLCSAQNPLC